MAAPVAISLYDVGDIARVSASFTDTAGAAADPTTVTAAVRAPDGTVTPYTVTAGQIVKDSTGHYHLDIACALPGDYYYRFNGTGAITAAEEGTFTVRAPEATLAGPLSATALTTLGAARLFVLEDATDGTQDTRIRMLIDAYSRSIYKYTRREWMPQTAATARVFNYDGSGVLSLDPYEARAVTAVTLFTDLPTASQRALVASSSTVLGEWRTNPAGGTPEGTILWLDVPTVGKRGPTWASGWPTDSPPSWITSPSNPALALGFQVTVTGDWGIANTLAGVPSDVQLACLIAVKDAYMNPEGFAARTGPGEVAFTEEASEVTPDYFQARNLPSEARSLLSPYRRSPGRFFA